MNLAPHEKSAPGEYAGVSAADGGVKVISEDRAAWERGTENLNWGEGQSLEIPDTDGGQTR